MLIKADKDWSPIPFSFEISFLSLTLTKAVKYLDRSATIVKYLEFRVQHSASRDAFLHLSFSHSHLNQYGRLFISGPRKTFFSWEYQGR